MGGVKTGGVAPVVHTPVTPKGGRNKKKKTKGKKKCLNKETIKSTNDLKRKKSGQRGMEGRLITASG